jgi:lactoylglutathione lyase
MKLGYAIVYVPDVAASLLFFERAFGLPRKFLHEGGDYGELDTGATTLAFAAHARALAAGARELAVPVQKPWGQLVSYLRCPDGLLVELCTPVGG